MVASVPENDDTYIDNAISPRGTYFPSTQREPVLARRPTQKVVVGCGWVVDFLGGGVVGRLVVAVVAVGW